MKKNPVFLVLLTLFLLSACSEKVDLKVVSPPANYRVTDPYVEGNSIPIPVSIYYEGTEDQKIAIIKNVNTRENYGCTLISGKENICGSILLTKVGGQSIQVFVAKNNDEIVSETVSFRWEPYQGLEKFAFEFSGVIGPKSLPLGYFYLFLVLAGILLVITLFFYFKFGYGHRQGDSAKVTIEFPNGLKVVEDHTRGAFHGPLDKDQLRPKLEADIFRSGVLNYISDPKEQSQILLSQGDIEVDE